MSNEFSSNDGIPQFDVDISTIITHATDISGEITVNDALPTGPPKDYELTATLIYSPWGGSLNNSYVSATDASSFIMTAIVDTKAWTGATWRDKIAAILEATRDIDSGSYIGARYYYDQRLLFPRQLTIGFPWNRTATGSTIWSVTMARMEQSVKQGTCWQALHILRNRGRDRALEAIAAGTRTQGISLQGSTLQASYGRAMQRLCPEAVTLLREWRTTPRVMRA
jgi:hypothetical protein